jgi:hypothetical protein
VPQQLELLARVEEARCEARVLQQAPEVIPRVREVRAGGRGDAAGVDSAEDGGQTESEDVRDIART